MFYLNVVAVLALVLFSQALSLMATSLHVPRGERSGVIAPLLRNAKVSRSVAHGLHIRQSSCPMGSFKCDDGELPLTPSTMFRISYVPSRRRLL